MKDSPISVAVTPNGWSFVKLCWTEVDDGLKKCRCYRDDRGRQEILHGTSRRECDDEETLLYTWNTNVCRIPFIKGGRCLDYTTDRKLVPKKTQTVKFTTCSRKMAIYITARWKTSIHANFFPWEGMCQRISHGLQMRLVLFLLIRTCVRWTTEMNLVDSSPDAVNVWIGNEQSVTSIHSGE